DTLCWSTWQDGDGQGSGCRLQDSRTTGCRLSEKAYMEEPVLLLQAGCKHDQSKTGNSQFSSRCSSWCGRLCQRTGTTGRCCCGSSDCPAGAKQFSRGDQPYPFQKGSCYLRCLS